MMMWGGWPNMMGGFLGTGGIIWMIFILIFILAVIVGVILLIVWIVKKVSSSGESKLYGKTDALGILDQRYAKGEISKKEYESMKKDIG